MGFVNNNNKIDLPELPFQVLHNIKAQKHTYGNALTRNSSLMKYFALVTRGSSPGSGVARRGERGK